jgi:hypothetical protein
MPEQEWKALGAGGAARLAWGPSTAFGLAPHFAQDDSVGRDSGISETLDLVAAPLRGRGRPRYTTWAVT